MNICLAMKESLKMEIDWEVKCEEFILGGEKSNHYALMRSDNGRILSVCSKMYAPFYNRDLKKLVERIESLSSFQCIGFEQFQRGKRILAFLKDSNPVPLVDSRSDHFLIIGNSHDQSSKIFLGLSNFMHRCENQFSRELYDLRFKHTHRLELSDDDIRLLLDKYEKGKREQIQMSKELSNVYMGMEDVSEFLQFMFPDPMMNALEMDTVNDALQRLRKRRRDMMESIQLEMENLGKNAWGMFNGVTYYTSNRMRRGTAGFGNTHGTAQQMNSRAWEYCTKLVDKRFIPDGNRSLV
jgi:hypothetical protein